MNASILQRQFEKIGARASVRDDRSRNARVGVAIDIDRDDEGEFFDIAIGRDAPEELAVVDVQPRLRHLLLLSRQRDEKHKFLCGHDERHWFVAAVPERAAASNVRTAFEALKPPAVRNELLRQKVKPKNRNRRRNEAFLRQGEWFFVPIGEHSFPELHILRNEPLRRGTGKPHMCEELVREGGELVYVSAQYPAGLTEPQYHRLLSRRPKLRNLQWIPQRRNPGVFVRGRVRHADHKTIVLHGWHQVLMNTETQAVAMRHVAFID
ncbi:hypothetical protein [Maioricimonas sp. JC845]|uniref:hypothetical protein n=1 Tax=Maioricimonas sp. JC845 TaxID=3232138 RepID=UPI0034584579